jgi:hypothetical protein
MNSLTIFLAMLKVASSLRRLDPTKVSTDCLDLTSDKFPLKVNDILSSSHMKKAAYFQSLRDMGIDKNLAMVGKKLHFSCMKQPGKGKLHIFFVGDSTMRQTHMHFLANEHMKISEEERNQRLNFEKALKEYDVATMNETILFQKVADDITASYVAWVGEPIVDKLAHMVNMVKPQDDVVLWMGTAIHNLYPKHAKYGWKDHREEMLTKFLTDLKKKVPTSTLLWDTPNFLDFPLMSAAPEKHGLGWIRDTDAMHLLGKWADTDVKICKQLGIAWTERFKLGRYYRGLACDGMHYGKDFGAESWGVFYDLVLQSGYAQVCAKQPANFCRDINQYDASFDEVQSRK